jgi:hypothetical protein
MSEDAPPEVTAIRRQRARRVQLVAAGIAGTLLALLATGCPTPADLANPDDYLAPAGGGSGSMGGSATGPDPCEVACVTKVFSGTATACKLCHSTAMDTRLGGLDLQSAGVTARLKGVATKHIEIDPPASPGDCPMGDKLIDVDNPANSWMLKKLKGMQKTCGTAMPSTAPLSAADMMCMETYISCVAGKPIGGGGGAAAGGSGGSGGSAAGGTSAGTGGAAAGTGGGGGTGGT